MRTPTRGGLAERRGRVAPGRRFQDSLLFLAKWLRSPLKIAAVMPSSPDLAAAMAACVPVEGDGLVVELGGGTGALTQGLIDRGIAPERLVVIERDFGFYKILRERFPETTVVLGDAAELSRLVRAAGFASRPVSAVVSGLPILTFPDDLQEAILREAFNLMGENGQFVQFTYGFGPPVPLKRLKKWGVVSELAGHAMRNMPPAHVWVFRRAVG
jgi:phosphatidylethanolamine/phosphatidyl-N-methylethanolamine N-methyltransferase